MNRAQLAAAAAKKTGITTAAAQQLIEACEETILERLRGGDQVNLQGFGCFSSKETQEHISSNPGTGERVTVKAGRKPVFRFSRTIKGKI